MKKPYRLPSLAVVWCVLLSCNLRVFIGAANPATPISARPTKDPSVSLSSTSVYRLSSGHSSVGNWNGVTAATSGFGYSWGIGGEWLGNIKNGDKGGNFDQKKGIAIPNIFYVQSSKNDNYEQVWTACFPMSTGDDGSNFHTNLITCQGSDNNWKEVDGGGYTGGTGSGGAKSGTLLFALQVSTGANGAAGFATNAKSAAYSPGMTAFSSKSNTNGGTLEAYVLTLFTNGRVGVMGTCKNGECGTGATGKPATPAYAPNVPNNFPTVQYNYDGTNMASTTSVVVQISAGNDHSCVILNTGLLRCSGQCGKGQCGTATAKSSGTLNQSEYPASVSFSALSALHPAPFNTWTLLPAQVGCGHQFTCVLLNTGYVTCFGDNSVYQTGTSSGAEYPTPTNLVSLPHATGGPAIQIAVGGSHACALLANGIAYCWGKNDLNQASSTAGNVGTPAAVQNPAGATAVQIVAGAEHTCLLFTSGNVNCAGSNALNQQGTTAASPVTLTTANAAANQVNPSTAFQNGTVIVGISAGSSAYATCFAVKPSGKTVQLYCSGSNYAVGAPQYQSNVANVCYVNNNNPTGSCQLKGTTFIGPVWVTSASNSTSSGVTNFNTGTAEPFADYTTWPVATSMTAYATNADPTKTDLKFTAWAPYTSFATNTPGWMWYIDGVACGYTNINSYSGFCTATAAVLAQVKQSPPLITLSWTGAPSNANWGFYACPRPIITNSSTNINVATTSTPIVVTVAVICATDAANPWTTGANVIASASLIGGSGNFNPTILSSSTPAAAIPAKPSIFTVSIPSGAGTQTIILTASGTMPFLTSLPGIINLIYPAPTLTRVATDFGNIGARYFTGAGASSSVVVWGSNFGVAGQATVTVSVDGVVFSVSAVTLNDTALSFKPARTLFSSFSPVTVVVTVADAALPSFLLAHVVPIISNAASKLGMDASGVVSLSLTNRIYRVYGSYFNVIPFTASVRGTILIPNVYNGSYLELTIPIPSPLSYVPTSVTFTTYGGFNATFNVTTIIEALPTFISVSTPSGYYAGNNIIAAAGGVASIAGVNFLGYTPSCTLGGISAPCAVVSDTLISVTTPTFNGSYAPLLLAATVGPSALSSVGAFYFAYTLPILVSISPSASYAASGLANNSFTVSGVGFGSGPSDLIYITLGGVTCDYAIWASSTTVTCILLSSSMLRMANSIVTLGLYGYLAAPPFASLLTLLPTPTISTIVAPNAAAYVDPSDILWLTGSSLGYGTAAVLNASGTLNPNAPVIGGFRLHSAQTGFLNCSLVYYPLKLGASLGCQPPPSIPCGIPMTAVISLELNITVRSPSFTFGVAPTLTYMGPTVMGSGTVLSKGESVYIYGANFGITSSVWTYVALNGVAIPTPATVLNDTTILSSLPPFSFLGQRNVALTLVANGSLVSPTSIALSYLTPSIMAISPNGSYAMTGVTAGRTFTITGSSFGSSQSDLAEVSVGGATCSTSTWSSPTSILCFYTQAQMKLIAASAVLANTVLVKLTGGSATTSYTAFTYFGPPTIVSSTFVNEPGAPGSVSLIRGYGLGHGPSYALYTNAVTPNLNAPVILNAGFIDTNTSIAYNCSRIDFPSTLAMDIFCTANTAVVTSAGTYLPYAILEDNITVVASATVNFKPVSVFLAVSWAPGIDYVAKAYPSTALAISYISPAPALLVTSSGGPPTSSVTCIVSLVSANTPPGSSINALLVGNASAASLSAWTFPVGIVGASNWNYTLSAQCSYGGSGPWFSPANNLNVALPALKTAWVVSPPSINMISRAIGSVSPNGLVAPFSPYPQVGVMASFNGGAWALASYSSFLSFPPTVSCTILPGAIAVGDYVQGWGTLTSTISNATSIATYTSAGIVGSVNNTFYVNATCTWSTGEVLATVASGVSSTVAVAASWATAPSATFLYNTPTSPAILSFSYYNATSRVWRLLNSSAAGAVDSDVSCAMSSVLTSSGNPVTVLGGALSTFSSLSGTMQVGAMSFLPLYAGLAAVFVDTTVQCSFRDQVLAPIAFRSTMKNLTVTATGSYPASILASSSSTSFTSICPSLSFSLSDADTGAVITSDSTASCLLSVVSATSVAGGSVSVGLGGALTATVTSGLGIISGWYIASSPLQAQVVAKVECFPLNGGPLAVNKFKFTILGAQVNWGASTTLNATYARVLVPYDLTSTVSITFSVANTTSSSNGTIKGLQTYFASNFPPAACSLSIAATSPYFSANAAASLAGGPVYYQSLPVPDGGVVSFEVRLAANAGYAVPLTVACSYGDANVYISAPLLLEVAPVVSQWFTPPPSLFTYNTQTASLAISFFLRAPVGLIPLNVSTSLATTDIACTIIPTVNGSSISFAGGASVNGFIAASNTMSFTGLSLSPSSSVVGMIVNISTACTFRKGLTIPSISATTSLQALSLAWTQSPPSSVIASTSAQTFGLPPLSLIMLNQDGTTLLESTGSCALTLLNATNVLGMKQAGVTLGGNLTTTPLNGVVSFVGWFVVAPSRTALTLLVTCSRIQRGPKLYANVSTTTFGGVVSWVDAATLSPPFPWPIFLYTTPNRVSLSINVTNATSLFSTASYDTIPYDSTVYPIVTCNLAIDSSTPASANAFLSGNPSLYNKVPVNQFGFVDFYPSIQAASGVVIYLRSKCYFGDDVITSSTFAVQLADVVAMWSSPPFPAFLFNTPMADSSFVLYARIPANATLSLAAALIPTNIAAISASDLFCSMSVVTTIGSSSVPYSFGVASPVDVATGSVTVTGFAISPIPPTAGTNVTIGASCTFKKYMTVPKLTSTTVLSGVHLLFISPPPVSAMPSSSTQLIIVPSFSAMLQDTSGNLLSTDSTTVCKVKVVNARDAFGAAISQAFVVGNSSYTASAGVVTISGWGLQIGIASSVNLTMDCTRAAGGDSIFLPFSMSFFGFSVGPKSSSTIATGLSSLVFLNSVPSNFTASLTVLNWTSVIAGKAYSNLTFGSIPTLTSSCSLSIPSSPVSSFFSLTGASSGYSNVAVSASGVAAFYFALTSTAPGVAVSLAVTCKVGDSTLSPILVTAAVTPLYLATLTGLSASGRASYAAPPTSFYYNSLLPTASFQLWANLSFAGGAQAPVSVFVLTGSELSCTASAVDGLAGAVSLGRNPKVSQLAADPIIVQFSGATPQPAIGAGLISGTFSVSCRFRSLPLPVASFSSYMLNTSLPWTTLPPATVSRTTRTAPITAFPMPPFSLSLKDASNALISSDNTGVCTLFSLGYLDSSGASYSKSYVTLGGQVQGTLSGGVITFSSVTITAPLLSIVELQVQCQPGAGGPTVVSPLTTVAIGGASVAWSQLQTLNPVASSTVSVFYNTPSKMSALVSLLLPLSRSSVTSPSVIPYSNASAPLISCTLSSLSPSVKLGGPIAGYTQLIDATGSVSFNVITLPTTYRTEAPLSLSCRLGDATLMSILRNVSVSGISASSLPSSWPALVVPSTSQYTIPLFSSFKVFVVDDFGTPMANDAAGAICTLKSTTLGFQQGPGLPNTQITAAAAKDYSVSFLVGTSSSSFVQASIINGTATFPSLGVTAKSMSVVQFEISCSRSSSGGTFYSTVLTQSTFTAFSVSYVPGRTPPASALYNTVYNVELQMFVQTALGSDWAFQNFTDPSGGTVCKLMVPQSDIAVGTTLRSGGTTISATGKSSVGLLLQVMGLPNSVAHLSSMCAIQGNDIFGPSYNTSVTALVANFVPPITGPLTAWPWNLREDTIVTPYPQVLVNPYPISASNPAFTPAQEKNFGCNVLPATNLSAAVLFGTSTFTTSLKLSQPDSPDPGMGYVYNPAAGAIVLNKIRLASWWNTTFDGVVRCFRLNVASDKIPDIPLTLRVPAVEVSWVVPPKGVLAAKEPTDFSLALTNLDVGFPIFVDNSTVCNVFNNESVPMENYQAVSVEGIVSFQSFKLLGQIGSNYSLSVSCKFGVQPFPNTLDISILIKGCLPGEAPSGGTSCSPCGTGYYSYGGEQPCTRCPYGVSCVDGILEVVPGYYLALPPDALADPIGYNLTVDATGLRFFPTFGPDTMLHSCWNADSCAVNVTEKSYGCSPGYTGVLCGVCDEGNGYVLDGLVCSPCAPESVNQFILSLGFVAALLAILYISFWLDFGSSSESKVIWRIAVNYISILAAFGTYIANGTTTFVQGFGYIQSVLSPGGGGAFSVSPIQCVFHLSFYFRYAVIIFLPFIIGFIAVSAILLNIVRYKIRDGLEAFKMEVIALFQAGRPMAIVFLILFMAYPSITRESFRMFGCTPAAIAGHTYLLADLRVRCGNVAHAAGVSGAFAVLFCVGLGFPLLFAWYLRRNETSVKRGPGDPFFGQLGFLYQGYKTDAWFMYSWEASIMIRKALLVAISVMSQDPVYQSCIAIILMVIVFGLQMHYRPFSKPLYNIVEGAALIILLLDLVVSLMYLRTVRLNLAADPSTSRYTSSVISAAQQSLIAEPTMLTSFNTTLVLFISNILMLLILLWAFFYVKVLEAREAKRSCLDSFFAFFDCTCARRVVVSKTDDMASKDVAALSSRLLAMKELLKTPPAPEPSSGSSPLALRGKSPSAVPQRSSSAIFLSSPLVSKNPLAVDPVRRAQLEAAAEEKKKRAPRPSKLLTALSQKSPLRPEKFPASPLKADAFLLKNPLPPKVPKAQTPGPASSPPASPTTAPPPPPSAAPSATTNTPSLSMSNPMKSATLPPPPMSSPSTTTPAEVASQLLPRPSTLPPSSSTLPPPPVTLPPPPSTLLPPPGLPPPPATLTAKSSGVSSTSFSTPSLSPNVSSSPLPSSSPRPPLSAPAISADEL